MSDRPQLDRDIHNLLDEANTLVLTMELRRVKADDKAPDLVVRLLKCAEQARTAGKEKAERHLRQVAKMIERQQKLEPS